MEHCVYTGVRRLIAKHTPGLYFSGFELNSGFRLLDASRFSHETASVPTFVPEVCSGGRVLDSH